MISNLKLFFKYFKLLDFITLKVSYKYKEEYNLRLNQCMLSGIESIDPPSDEVEIGYLIDIKFKNGAVAKIWDTNKYYGWGTKCSFYNLPDAKFEVVTFSNDRPAIFTLYRLRNQIERFNLGYDTGGFPQHAPQQVIVQSQRLTLEDVF